MQETPEVEGWPPQLRFLKWLVTALAGVMICGFLVLIAALVIRLNAGPTAPGLPATLDLPDDATAIAVTAGPNWYAVVTEDQRILIFDTEGALRQDLEIQVD